jgi:hypothetical protein
MKTTMSETDEVVVANGEKRKVILTRSVGVPMVSIREVKSNGVRNVHQEVTLVEEELQKVALELMRPDAATEAAACGDEPDLAALAVKLAVNALLAVAKFRAGDVVGGIENTSAAFQAAAKLRFKAHGLLAVKGQLDGAETQTHTDEH